MNIKNFDPKGKSIQEIIRVADTCFRGDKEEKIKAKLLYEFALGKVPNSQDGDKPYILRGIIRKRIWDCDKKLYGNDNFFSEAGQDKIIKDKFFKEHKNGFFVEIGAFDGVEGSNCYYFEKYLEWEGIAIEASPKQFEKLVKNRECQKMNVVIGSAENEVEFFEVVDGFTQMSGINNANFKNSYDRIKKNSNSKINIINTKCVTFENIIPSNRIIDLISIDIEGGEPEVINTIDFNKYEIKVILVENNVPNKQSYIQFFKDRNFSYFERVGMDEIYYNNKFFNFK